MSHKRPFDGLNIEYTPIDWKKTEELQREYQAIPVAVTMKGLYRLFHNGLPHYFMRLDDALDFWRFCKGHKGGDGVGDN